MKFKKAAALLLTLIITVFTVPAPAVFAESGVVFSLSSNIAEGESPDLGSTVTYTVGITENTGFCAGTMYFKPSENLTYVSSSMLGNQAEAIEAVGENKGSFGLTYLEKNNYTETSENFCSITFLVNGLGDISCEFYAFQLIANNDGLTDVTSSVLPASKITGTVKTPNKPTITTEKLTDAILGKNYSFNFEADRNDYISWSVSSGTLPAGLTLFDNGTLSGTLEEFGEFSFGVKVSVADTVLSDEVLFTLKVLEKPRTLELKETSGYTMDESGFIKKIIAETKYSDFINNFLNSEYIKVYDGKGNLISDENAYIGTGFKVQLEDGGTVLDSAETVILGDINGDGIITSVDYLRLRAYFNGNFELEGACNAAAHVAGNDNISSVDYLRLRAFFNGNYDIYK